MVAVVAAVAAFVCLRVWLIVCCFLPSSPICRCPHVAVVVVVLVVVVVVRCCALLVCVLCVAACRCVLSSAWLCVCVRACACLCGVDVCAVVVGVVGVAP